MTDSATATADNRIARLLQQAMAHLQRRSVGQAEALAAQALAQAPKNADALQLLGLIRQMQGRAPLAEDLYRRSLAVLPDQPSVLFNLGMLLFQQARYDDALAEFEQVLRLKPEEPDTLFMCGQCYQSLRNVPRAEEAYRHVLRLQPDSINARQCLGGLWADEGRGEEAEAILREALAMNPADPKQIGLLKQFLGVAVQKQRRLSEALEYFDAAQSASPGMPMVDYCRGLTLEDMGDLEGALDNYRSAVERDPLNVQAHKDLNYLLYRLKREDEFLKSIDEAAAKQPRSGALALLKGNLLLKTDRDDEAIEALENAARLMPRYAAPNDMLGTLYARQGRFDEAIKAHERATAIEPKNATMWAHVADTFLRADDPERALEAAECALAAEPDQQGALANWSLALRKLGDPRDEELNDYENFVQVFDLPPPDGYDDMETFNRDLNAYLDPMHNDIREPLEQTLRGGTQTHDNLIGRGHDLVERLRARIDDAILAYIETMKEDDKHPLFRRRSRNTRFAGSWSARLSDCGFHTNHVHPYGWISSCYYVALPDAVADKDGKQGWIKFGEPGFDMGLKNPIHRIEQPAPGRLVLFPSYMWHGTVPFRSSQTRTTIAFDVVPR